MASEREIRYVVLYQLDTLGGEGARLGLWDNWWENKSDILNTLMTFIGLVLVIFALGQVNQIVQFQTGGVEANIAANPTSGQPPLTVVFVSSVTRGAEPYSYSWSFGDGEFSTEANPEHTYSIDGTFTATLTVRDAHGDIASDSVLIVVQSFPLTVRLIADKTSGTAPLEVRFSALVSGGTSPVSIAWNFGDGGEGSGTSIAHSYKSAGTYTANVVVRDSQGRIASDETSIQVAAPKTPGFDAMVVFLAIGTAIAALRMRGRKPP